MAPSVKALDHLVLTVADIPATVRFYSTALGMRPVEFSVADGTVRRALNFGKQKINLHLKGHAFEPKAKTATTGSADLCFLSDTAIPLWIEHLTDLGINIIEGPVPRTGAAGPITSIYVRDPDGNLIEISTPN